MLVVCYAVTFAIHFAQISLTKLWEVKIMLNCKMYHDNCTEWNKMLRFSTKQKRDKGNGN